MTNSGSYQIDGDVFYGSTPKFKLTIDAGIPMSSYDFDITLVCKNRSITITKQEMPRDSEDNYYVCFDTKDLGIGPVKAVVNAYINDSSFPGGVRKEVSVIDMVINIKSV